MADSNLTGLIARYGRLVRSVVAKVSKRRDHDLADEIEQRVAMALWGQIRREQNIEFPASYIYRCAVRETVRELSRELSRHGEVDAETAVAGGVDGDPERAATGSELAAATESCLGQMLAERATATRAHLAGLDVEEIMGLHGWSYQKARNLIARGMADLRELLGERGFP